MLTRVLILGGYGNFGSFISKTLAKDACLTVIVAGRSLSKAQALVASFDAANQAEAVELDINQDLHQALATIAPDIVIHTCGPFQQQAYSVAEACIATGTHYIDLADGRDFVAGITELDAKTKVADVLLVSGASSVPCLTSALVDHYQSEFSQLQSLDFGISTAQRTARGLATTEAILGYTGRPFTTLIEGKSQPIFGWQDMQARNFSGLGRRLLSNCDVPDLALFPQRYPTLKTVRFYAGLEISFVHITLWALSYLVRLGLIRNLQSWAPLLLKTSYLFDFLGSANSGFYMNLQGQGNDGQTKEITFELIARSGDGPYIPCMPAILLAKKIARGEMHQRGAFPCMGLISKDEYLNALSELDISWHEN